MKAYRHVFLVAIAVFAVSATFSAALATGAATIAPERAPRVAVATRATTVAAPKWAVAARRVAPAAKFPTVMVHVAVRSPEATDAGPGSAATPFRTIQHAIDVAEANNGRGVATTVDVKPGVYREYLQFEPPSRQTAAPIIVQGPSTNDAIVSAADVWTGWVRSANGLYTHPWPYQWGPAPIPAGWEDAGVTPIVQRRETLFVNGVLLRQVLSASALHSVAGGAFFVSEPSQTVYVKQPHGVSLAHALVEVGARARVLLEDGQNHVTIRRLRFKGATTAFAPAGILVGVSNVQLDRVTFGWNNWTGFEVDDGVNVTVSNSTFDHNGAMGISGQRNRNLVLLNDENSYNNWRGAWGGMRLWENGMKLSSTHGARITHFVAVGNQAPGMWLDTDNRNVTISNSKFEHNAIDGILLEANQGPVTLQSNVVCDNGRAGIFYGRTNSVSVVANHSFGNTTAQLLFSGSPLVRSVTDWQTGVTTDVRSEGWTIRNNTFGGSGTSQLLVGGWGVPAPAWTLMADTMHARDDTYIHDDTSRPFWIPGTNERGSIGNWIAASGETGSRFSTGRVSFACK